MQAWHSIKASEIPLLLNDTESLARERQALELIKQALIEQNPELKSKLEKKEGKLTKLKRLLFQANNKSKYRSPEKTALKHIENQAKKILNNYKSKFKNSIHSTSQNNSSSEEAKKCLIQIGSEELLFELEKLYAKFPDYRYFNQVLNKYSMPSTTNWNNNNPIPQYPNSSFKPKSINKLTASYGKLSIYKFPQKIIDEPIVLNPKLINSQVLSGHDGSSYLVIQGLVDEGKTDITLQHPQAFQSYTVELKNNPKAEQTSSARAAPYKEIEKIKIEMPTNAMLNIELSDFLDEYLLIGNQDLLHLIQLVKDIQNPKFLKAFALASSNKEGESNIIIPTLSKIFELEITVKEGASNNYAKSIYL